MRKNRTNFIPSSLILACLLLSLASCSEQTDPTWHTIEFNYGKPGAPVSLRYQVADELQPDEPFEVDILINSNTSAGSIEVKLNADQGLELASNNRFSFNLAEHDKRLLAVLVATTEGVIYLNVNAYEKDVSGNPLQARSFAIPITVGAGSTPTNQKPTASTDQPASDLKLIQAGEETIIELPAESK